jgi:2Fe-2S ferredoxin
MSFLHVTDQAGKHHKLEAVDGWRVMEIFREHGLPIEAQCGGACECATCHVVVDDKWVEKLHPPRDDEQDMLDDVPTVTDNSRLSCQIIWSEELDGLELTLVDMPEGMSL